MSGPFNSPPGSVRGPGSATAPASAARAHDVPSPRNGFRGSSSSECCCDDLPRAGCSVHGANGNSRSFLEALEVGQQASPAQPSAPPASPAQSQSFMLSSAIKPAVLQSLQAFKPEIKDLVEKAIDGTDWDEELKPLKDQLEDITEMVKAMKTQVKTIAEQKSWTSEFAALKDEVRRIAGESSANGVLIKDMAVDLHKTTRRNAQLTGERNASRARVKDLQAELRQLKSGKGGGGGGPAPPDPPRDRAEAISDSGAGEEEEEGAEGEEEEEDEIEGDSEPEETARLASKRARPAAAAASSSSSSSSNSGVLAYSGGGYKPLTVTMQKDLAERARQAAEAMLAEPRVNHKYCSRCDFVFDSVSEAVDHYNSAAHAARK
jgi:hypothetical protein